MMCNACNNFDSTVDALLATKNNHKKSTKAMTQKEPNCRSSDETL